MAGNLNLAALLKLPTCEKCKQMIVGKMLRALGKTWHDTCFVCAACGQSLSGGFQMDESRTPDEPELPQHKPHCPDCYARLFMPPCKGCGKNIADKAYVQACKGAWHERCFVCTRCKKELASGTKHWPVDDMPYCQIHFLEAKAQSQGKKPARTPTSAPKSASRPQLPPSSSSSRPQVPASSSSRPQLPASSSSRPQLSPSSSSRPQLPSPASTSASQQQLPPSSPTPTPTPASRPQLPGASCLQGPGPGTKAPAESYIAPPKPGK